MALWGDSDNLASVGTVSLNYNTLVVTGSGTSFNTLEVGDILRFGVRGGTYFGDAVISGITSALVCSIASTAGLSGSAISGVQYYASELPLYTGDDVTYSKSTSGTNDKLVYGISTSVVADYGTSGLSTNYHIAHHGWVGVTTYIDMHGRLRVKSEVLVAQSGIQTGSNGIIYNTAK
jgi:hypothetical protein